MKFFRFWFPVILYSGIIFYASSIPNVRAPLSEIQFDKVLHIVEFMPLGFLVARGLYSQNLAVSGNVLLVFVFLASFLYGASDEYHQFLVVGRDAGLIDLMADTVGGTIGGAAYLSFVKTRNK